VIAATTTRSGVGALADALPCIGTDRLTGDLARTAPFDDQAYLEASWHGVVSAQVPDYLCFMLQKSSKVFVLGGDAGDDAVGLRVDDWGYNRGNPAAGGSQAGLDNYFRVRNTDSSAAIIDFSLEVQSSIGAYTYSDQSWPHLRTRHELWRDHLKYVVDGYCGDDINKWFKNQCCLLLGSDSWIRGLSTTGVAFPITINAKCKFVSARQLIVAPQRLPGMEPLPPQFFVIAYRGQR